MIRGVKHLFYDERLRVGLVWLEEEKVLERETSAWLSRT